MDIIAELIKKQTVLAKLYNEFGGDKETYEMLWTAVAENDKNQAITLLDFVLMDLGEIAHSNKANNGLLELLNLTDFNSKLQEDIARGKRKVSSLSDIMDVKDSKEKVEEKIKPKEEIKQVKPTNILDI